MNENEAKEQVAQFERNLKKTFDDYIKRLGLIKERNILLTGIRKNKRGLTPEMERSLLKILDEEREIIGTLNEEGKLDITQIEVALEGLEKVKKEPAILEELEKRNVDIPGLEKATTDGLEILTHMRKRLHHVEERILIEEGLIGSFLHEGFDRKKFNTYLKVWKGEVKEEEKLRKFVHRKAKSKLRTKLTIGGVFTIFVSMVGAPPAIAYDATIIPQIAATIGIFLAVYNFIGMLNESVENEGKINIYSKNVIKYLKSAT